jgi:DNA polymerase
MVVSSREDASSFVPKDRALLMLRETVQHCRGCDLYQNATQAVFGELEMGAESMMPKVAIMMIANSLATTKKLISISVSKNVQRWF